MSFASSAHHARSNTSSLTGGGARTVHGSFKLTVDHDLVFPQGETTLIVGPTGSGKTALLLALLGELHATPLDNGHQLGDGNGHATSGTTKASVHLPRSGGIAYAAQDGWIMNATVRENIVFGASFPFSLTRYTAVLHACALNPDLTRLPAGDDTEIGERGTTLSGGQRARITLARAVYSEARTVLLDDMLAALDVHTGRWIVEKCLRGDLMKERTVVMVTHNVPLAGRVAKNVVKVGSDGRVGKVEALENLKEELSGAGSGSGEMKDEYESGRKVLDLDVVEENVLGPGTDKDIDADADKVDIHLKVPSGTLVQEETVAEGHVSWASCA
jgi:ABC-type transport system involved in cytochrome bd biosynthesis fused ATPase/permease subunit